VPCRGIYYRTATDNRLSLVFFCHERQPRPDWGSLSLSLSIWRVSRGRIAASTSRRHAGLSVARRRQAQVERAQIILNRSQPGLPRSSMQAQGIREWSAQHRWPKDKRRWRIISCRSGCPVCDRTTSLETKSVQWIWRMRLRHQSSSASIFFSRVDVRHHISEP